MCGIFGIISPGQIKEQLETSTATLTHRGPDDVGYFVGDGVGLGHRRLSIIDLEGGHQPMFNEDNSISIVFNGEIYNFPELREYLMARGHTFQTKSDTETIVHAYEEWGDGCVEKMSGMFAFAIWDARDRSLFLARDRLGIKPLFYSDFGPKFSFGSEIKAILADQTCPRTIDETALACYFSLSYIPAPMTIYRDVRQLLPGHTLTWKNGKTHLRKYWDLQFEPDRGKDEQYFVTGFMELLNDAVKSHLISDVPLGAFLSGGIDSSAVVALMAKMTSSPVNSFCMGFGGQVGGYLDERGFARMVADKYDTNHREYEVMPHAEGILDTIVRAFDEPFADDSTIPSYFVCKVARENVTVAQSGLGGDELFAGYERYLGFELRNIYRKIPSLIREVFIRNIIEGLPERKDGHYTVNHMKRFVRSSSLSADLAYYGYMTILTPRIADALFSDRKRFGQELLNCRDFVLQYFNAQNSHNAADSLNRAFYCDAKTYLPSDILAVTDRMSMHHALEVRVPFLDHRLVEFCATVPPEMKMKRFQKKYLLKKAVRGLLPDDVIDHRKQGFVGPMAQWLKHDLKHYVVETLSEKNISKHGYLNPRTVKTILEEHFSGKEIHDTLIWAMLVFQRWHELYME